MPGHKGAGNGAEKYDITEIQGADSLFEADGIILESEKIAGEIFGADTFYSTEGSSLSIRAMTYLISLYAKSRAERPIIAAARNVHKSFVSAAALLDVEVDWITSSGTTYLSSEISAVDVERYLKDRETLPTALYLTSPDYIGHTSPISEIANVCHRNGILLVVDNAHGAYLKFMSPSSHPIDLGADMCCDSAHKTLNALTGAAYLHISRKAPLFFRDNAKTALSLFASTSPSYLILKSLDELNSYLAENYKNHLNDFIVHLNSLKARLTTHGYEIAETEPMKLTIKAKKYGYTGHELADILAKREIFSEFADKDFLVLMLTPNNSENDISLLSEAFLQIPKREEIATQPPPFVIPKKAISIREAVLSNQETLPIESCIGRTLASVTVGCPPAIPIVVSGEIIDEGSIEIFKYYGIENCTVTK